MICCLCENESKNLNLVASTRDLYRIPHRESYKNLKNDKKIME